MLHWFLVGFSRGIHYWEIITDPDQEVLRDSSGNVRPDIFIGVAERPWNTCSPLPSVPRMVRPSSNTADSGAGSVPLHLYDCSAGCAGVPVSPSLSQPRDYGWSSDLTVSSAGHVRIYSSEQITPGGRVGVLLNMDAPPGINGVGFFIEVGTVAPHKYFFLL